MFTGIVEEAGTVERIQPTAKAIELTVRARLIGRSSRRATDAAPSKSAVSSVARRTASSAR